MDEPIDIPDPVNRVIEALREIIDRAPDTFVVHGTRDFSLDDPELPVERAVKFVVSRLKSLS